MMIQYPRPASSGEGKKAKLRVKFKKKTTNLLSIAAI